MGLPYSSPATFVIRADVAVFKDLVQTLTGPLDGSDHKPRRRGTVSRRSPFKLQERRKHSVRDLQVIKSEVVESSGSSAHSNGPSSPAKGPTTSVGCDVDRVGAESPLSEEERAIAEKGFYLHELPVKAEPPVLLTLFPLTSPKKEL